jgi:hypothetical protein
LTASNRLGLRLWLLLNSLDDNGQWFFLGLSQFVVQTTLCETHRIIKQEHVIRLSVSERQQYQSVS